MNMDDDRILDLYWARSESAIHETAKKYGHYCSAIANNILHSREDAQECVNDSYLKAWESIPPQRPAAFRVFLGRITRNLSLNKYKAQKTQKRGGNDVDLIFHELEECLPAGGSVEKAYEAALVTEAINACLRSLDSETRIVFVRRYWYADSIRAIAERFHMNESRVKSMLFRTRKTLKTHLENEGVLL